MPEAAEKVILAVDLGTSGAKVALITVRGRVLGWEAQEVALYLTPDGGAEQAPEDWWQAFLRAGGRELRSASRCGRSGRGLQGAFIGVPADTEDLVIVFLF